jgi:hypothetical protein
MATAIRPGDAVAQARPATVQAHHAGYFFHPVVDFLLAGGGSLLVALPLILLIRDKEAIKASSLWWGFALSNVLNFPHFANSYQLLYTGIGQRIFGADSSQKVRLRYIWAGFVAPVLILGFMFAAYALGHPRMLGYAANAMVFTSGWHYVKQGYGVITVLSAIRRIYYSEIEKRLLLVNGYVVWIYSWLAFNKTLHEEALYGVKYFTFDIPPTLLTIGAVAATLTTAAVVGALAVRILVRRQSVSWNGIVGYACALYLWVVAFYYDVIFAIFIPAFHSLQYLLFTWRYQLNKVSSDGPVAADAAPVRRSRPPAFRFAKFVGLGLVLGWFGFVGLPMLFHARLSPDPVVFGPSVFVFIFVLWINIHHYFIDNVIWRRDNEDVRKYLFAPR